jgi:hypothetical protein
MYFFYYTATEEPGFTLGIATGYGLNDRWIGVRVK